MRAFKCHKVVCAGKVLAAQPPEEPDAGVVLTLEGADKIVVSPEWVEKHAPNTHYLHLIGGYYVRYEDGYTSWSPADAFETGYTDLEALEAELLREVGAEPIMQYFAYKHLPPVLQEVSRGWCDLALQTLKQPRSAERSVALRKLLEGKDAAVRAALPIRHSAR